VIDVRRVGSYAVLLATLGLVAAFLVSAIRGTEPEVRQPSEPEDGPGLPYADRDQPVEAPVRVEVLNGAGKPGLARTATDRLRGEGFDVVFFGNALRFDHTRSVVLDRVGDVARARAVAEVLGIDSVDTIIDPGLLLDVSVVLGADWPPVSQPPVGTMDRFRQLLTPRGDGVP
jgi:hypothetical protein